MSTPPYSPAEFESLQKRLSDELSYIRKPMGRIVLTLPLPDQQENARLTQLCQIFTKVIHSFSQAGADRTGSSDCRAQLNDYFPDRASDVLLREPCAGPRPAFDRLIDHRYSGYAALVVPSEVGIVAIRRAVELGQRWQHGEEPNLFI